MREQLTRLDERIAAHDAECARTSGHAVNPDNEIGGIRSRSKRSKGRLLDRWDEQARESARLHDQRRTLTARIAWLEAAPIRERVDALVLAAWDALEVGDPFPRRPDSPTVARRSPYSVTTNTGTRWTCEEVTGLSRTRVAELVDLHYRTPVAGIPF